MIKFMIDGMRGTGRTTRMIECIKEALTENKKIYVIMKSRHDKKMIKENLSKSKNLFVLFMDDVNFDIDKMEVVGVEYGTTIFIDHAVYEGLCNRGVGSISTS